MKSIKKIVVSILMKRLARKNMISTPETIQLPAMEFIGYSITTTIKNNQQKKDIPPFYHHVYDNNKLNELCANRDLKMYCIFDLHDNKEDFDYYIAVENCKLIDKDECAKFRTEKGRFVKVDFLKRNNKIVNMVMMYMRFVWLKLNGFVERNAQPFILYDERFHSNYKKYGCKGDDYQGYPAASLYLPVED